MAKPKKQRFTAKMVRFEYLKSSTADIEWEEPEVGCEVNYNDDRKIIKKEHHSQNWDGTYTTDNLMVQLKMFFKVSAVTSGQIHEKEVYDSMFRRNRKTMNDKRLKIMNANPLEFQVFEKEDGGWTVCPGEYQRILKSWGFMK